MKYFTYIIFLISLNSLAQSDLKIDSVFNQSNENNYFSRGLDYYKMPINYIHLIEFSANVSNIGTNTETNCYLKVDVIYNNNTIYSDSSNVITMASLDSDSLLIIAPLDLSNESLGDYKFIYSLHSDGIDNNMTNNRDTIEFELTNYTIARHDSNQISQSIDIYTPSDNYWGIGYLFEIPENACLSYASVWVTDDIFSDGRTLQAELWELDTINGSFIRLTWTEPSIVGFGGVRNPTRLLFPFQNANELSSDKIYFIGVYYSANSVVRIQLTENKTPNTVFEMNGSFIPGGVTFSIDTLLNAYMPRIDIEFDNSIQCTLIDEENINNNKELTFPNPFTNELNLSFETLANGELIIFDVDGKIVYSETINNTTSLIVNSSNFEAGLYFYKLVNTDTGLSIGRGKIVKQ